MIQLSFYQIVIFFLCGSIFGILVIKFILYHHATPLPVSTAKIVAILAEKI